tara:strand:- start:1836 stop:3236 length:1401 start_codon:yes stop_codon:yes gene_type:complete
MPIQNPLAAIAFPSFLSPTNGIKEWEGLLHPTYLKGGFQSVPTIAERNAIPIWAETEVATHAGFADSQDGGYTTGRRQIGMLVYVLENNKFYTLCPKGYFVNPVDENTPAGGETEWQALSEWVKAGLMKPNSTSIYNDTLGGPPTFSPDQYTPASIEANDPWMELEFGGDNIYSSGLASGLTMTEDVGGMPTGTTVADLTEIKTYDQLFDTILFPTSFPTMTQPSVALTPDGGLKIIGTNLLDSFNLITAANQGNWKLNGVTQGVLSGDVTAASITGPEGPFTLAVNAPTGIADQIVSNHVVDVGSNSWTLTATFAAGPVPADSTGTPYPSGQFTGGDKSNSAAFEGVYPYFLGTDQNGFQQAGLRSHSTGTSVTNTNLIIQADQGYDEVNQSLHHRISISDAHIAGRSIQVWVYSPVSTQYSDATDKWVTSPETRTIAGVNGVPYTLLSKTVSSGGPNLYRIKFV